MSILNTVVYHIITSHVYFQVAAISGDARRALEICRRAAELADYRLKHLSGQSKDISADDNSGSS